MHGTGLDPEWEKLVSIKGIIGTIDSIGYWLQV